MTGESITDVSSPKAFVCHASEDKERFVTVFAARLRAHGVDAWVDAWEVRPGDSLVDRIFEEGLKNADAVLVVLSVASIQKRWVREELNASVVKRIEMNCRIIPILLDGLPEEGVPESLRSTAWERISDLNDYGTSFGRILAALYGHSEKPALGQPPAFAQAEARMLPGLTKIDSLLLKLVGELAVEEDSGILHPHSIVERAALLGIASETAMESLLILDGRGYVEVETSMSDDLVLLRTTMFGFQEYAKSYMADYGDVATGVAVRLVNHQEEASEEIARSLGRPHFLIRHILDVLESKGLVKLVRFGNYGVRVLRVSPELARLLS